MYKKINIEDLLYEEAIKYIYNSELENAFIAKYTALLPEMKFELEEEFTDAASANEKLTFNAGFRMAVALMNGQSEMDMDEILK